MERHMTGFEKEAKLQAMYAHPEIRKRLYRWADFMAVARVINAELCKGAFGRRACERTLRFIGYDNFDLSRCDPDYDQYKYGKIYHSVDFNGATYTIRETNKRIGCAYFEFVEE